MKLIRKTKQMRFLYFVSMVALLLLNSCAAILSPRNQDVYVENLDKRELVLDGEKIKTDQKDRIKISLKKDLEAHEILIKAKGYKDKRVIVMQTKRSFLSYFNIPLLGLAIYGVHKIDGVPFGGKLVGDMMLVGAVGYYDDAPWSYNFERKIALDREMIKIPEREEDFCQLVLKNVKINKEKENRVYKRFKSFRAFADHPELPKVEKEASKSHVPSEEICELLLREVLVERAYVDTSLQELSTNFSNKLYIKPSIERYEFNQISSEIRSRFGWSRSVMFCDLTIKWEIQSSKGTTLFTETTDVQSSDYLFTPKFGTFIAEDNTIEEDDFSLMIKDALETGFFQLVAINEVRQLLKDYHTDEVLVPSTESDDAFIEKEAPERLSQQDSKEENLKGKLKLSVGELVARNVDDAVKASLTIKTDGNTASGFFITSNGYVITSYEAVVNQNAFTAELEDGSEQALSLIYYSEESELALLKMEVKNQMAIKFSKAEELEIGTSVFVIGTPLDDVLSQTVSAGIISGIRKNEEGRRRVQTDASINIGVTGGPIIDEKGRLIAVVGRETMVEGAEGVAFGIPVQVIEGALNIELD